MTSKTSKTKDKRMRRNNNMGKIRKNKLNSQGSTKSQEKLFFLINEK